MNIHIKLKQYFEENTDWDIVISDCETDLRITFDNGRYKKYDFNGGDYWQAVKIIDEDGSNNE